MMATFTTKTNANSNRALDAVANTIFPTNAYAKQKKYMCQGMWKPKALTIRNIYTRICELNDQLLSFPNQTGLMPEDEMKLAFISLCAPEWQQEFLKTGINKYSSTWVEILVKAKALEQAEVAIAEMAPASDQQQGTKHDQEAGEIAPKEGSKKKAKTAFYCKMHGPDQRHNTQNCKVINAEIEKLKGRKPPPYNNQQQGSEQRKQWTCEDGMPRYTYYVVNGILESGTYYY
jgi:hypothetical protein